MTQAPRLSRVRDRLGPAAPWLILTLALTAIAWSTAPSVYSPLSALAFACTYAALAAVLCTLAPLGARFHRNGEAPAALVVGLVLAWHWREQTRPPGVGPTLWTIEGLLPFLGTVIVSAGLFFLLDRAFARTPRQWNPRWTIATGVIFLALWAGLFHVAETSRWHLLNHNRLLGTPAYHLFATPTSEIEEALWEANSGAVDYSYESDALALAETDSTTLSNIVVVVVDTLRADGLAGWGGDPALMPFLNRYAAASYVFTDVLSNSSWTRPSIASLFTGLLPEEHGAVGWEYLLVPDRLTVAEILQDRGYETTGIVANYQAINPDAGFGQGFDSYAILRSTSAPYARAEDVNAAVGDWLDQRAGGGEATADDAIGSRPRPAFLYVHYLDPHTPYLVGDASGRADPPSSHAAARSLYDRELTYLDTHLEELIRMLDERLAGDTAVVIISDHGEEFGEHGQRGHGQSLYRELTDVPVIVHLPDGRRGTIEARLESRDFFAAILRLQDSTTVDLPVWSAQTDRPTRYASVSNSKDPGPSQWLHNLLRPYRNSVLLRMADEGQERLIWSAYGDTRELYERSSDPEELRNLLRSRPESAARLGATLDAAPRWWAPRITRALTEDALRELRALGYVR